MAQLSTNLTAAPSGHIGLHNEERAEINARAPIGAAVFYAGRYGVVGGNGTTDDATALRSLFAAAQAYINVIGRDAVVDVRGLGVVSINTGVSKTVASIKNAAGTGPSIDAGSTSNWAHQGIAIQPNLPARLWIQGAGTTFKFGSDVYTLFFVDKQRDYDVVQNVDFADFTVDDNHTQAKSHVVFGAVPAYDQKMRYLSWQNIRIANVNVINADTDTTSPAGGGTIGRTAFSLLGEHNGGNEATQTFSKNITTVGGSMEGGNGLYGIFSIASSRVRPGGTNHYYDQIHIGSGWRHTNAVPLDRQRYQTSVYICGSGFGDYFTIGRGFSSNIGDDVIEVGAMMRGEIVEPSCVDPVFNLILFRNTHPAIDPARQQINVRRANCKITPALSSMTVSFAAPIAWIMDDLYLQVALSGTVTGGTFTLTIPLASGSVTTAAIPYNATAAQVAAAVNAVVTPVATGSQNGGVTEATGGPLAVGTPVNFVLVSQSLSATPATATSSLTGGGGVTVQLDPAGTCFGNFLLEDLTFDAEGLTYSRQTRTDLLLKGPGASVPILGIELIRPKVRLKNYVYDAGNTNQELCLAKTNGTYANWPVRLIVRDAKLDAPGSDLGAGSGNGALSLFVIDGVNTFADIDGIETDFSTASRGSWNHVYVAKNGGSGIRAFVARAKAKAQVMQPGAQYNGVRLGTAGAITALRISNCDYTVFGNGANAVVLPASTAGGSAVANAARTHASGVFTSAPPATSTPTFTGTPGVWQNLTGFTQTVMVAGGTVTKIERGDLAGTYLDTGAVAGPFTVPPGHSLRVTSSAAPTVAAMVQP